MREGSSGAAEGQPPGRHEIALSDEIRGAVSFQSYEKGRTIEDVWTRPARRHHGENGWFMELYRLREGRVEAWEARDWQMRQLSLSRAAPHRLNAFHLHPRVSQNEVWMVLEGVLAVWLVDCRRGSPSEGVRQRVILSGEEPAHLFIPAGVAHGYRAGSDGALLLYAMDQQFDARDPNEGRLPWDFFGAELWAEDRG